GAACRSPRVLPPAAGSPLATNRWLADDPSFEHYGRRNQMLSDNDAIATVAVKNLETAKQFYEGTLGLTKTMENEEVLAFTTGKSTIFLYCSQFPRTAHTS